VRLPEEVEHDGSRSRQSNHQDTRVDASGDVINQGGRLYVDRIAKTLGDIRTEDDGKTTIESENPDRPEVD